MNTPKCDWSAITQFSLLIIRSESRAYFRFVLLKLFLKMTRDSCLVDFTQSLSDERIVSTLQGYGLLPLEKACVEFKAMHRQPTNRSLDVLSAEFGARYVKELLLGTRNSHCLR